LLVYSLRLNGVFCLNLLKL